MMDTGKRYYIVDTQGNHYVMKGKNRLKPVESIVDEETFSLRTANDILETVRKPGKFSLLEVKSAVPVMDDNAYEAPEYDSVVKPTMFDGLNNDWEEIVENLCYMSDHIGEYQKNLNQQLSDVDKEISDLLHYLELTDLDNAEMLKVSYMLKERRCHRRTIKDEMEKTSLMCGTFMDSAFGIKVHQSLGQMEKMKHRSYTPRKLNDLFQQSQKTA